MMMEQHESGSTLTMMECARLFLQQLDESIKNERDALSSQKGEVLLKKNLKALQAYIEAKYSEGTERKTEKELLVLLRSHDIKNTDRFFSFVEERCYTPFKEFAAERCEDTYKLLSSKVHAINKKVLIEKTGGVESEKAFQFILDCFNLTPINYRYESFRDPNLEVLYSNDGLRFKAHDTYVNQFFRFFIDGDGGYPYDSERYYGSLPVQQSKVIACCKQIGMPQEYIDKLLSIACCSDRFVVSEDGELSLKKQYLLNNYAISVAILYEYGRPLHKEELVEQIRKLHSQYPALVRKPNLKSFVIRRKPILCSMGAQGTWGLETWKLDGRDVMTIIREFVSDTYRKTQQPVPLDDIVAYVKSLGFTYEDRSIHTYVTTAGCKGVGDNTYYPVDSDQKAAVRAYRNKAHLIQRKAAEYLLDHPLSKRSDVKDYVASQCGYPINYMTFEKALFDSRPDLFLKEGKSRYQKIKLSDKIKNKTAIKKEIPDPEKQEPEHLTKIRTGIIEYLKNHESALQTDLVKLFIDKMPSHLKSKDAPIRALLGDSAIFLKTTEKPVRVSLQPLYLQKLMLDAPKESSDKPASAETQAFSWEDLKKGLVQLLSPRDFDELLPQYVDKMFFIIRGGHDELLPNSNFRMLVLKLFSYVTGQTAIEQRRALQKEILSLMETYLKEFHRLKYSDDLSDYKGFGKVKLLFIEKGLIPNKDGGYLPKDQLLVARAADNINTRRNAQVGHINAFSEQSDKQTTGDIHDCLILMLHLAKKL